MRTLSTQVRLHRLIRAFDESSDRLETEPMERDHAGSVVARLIGLAELVRESWERESRSGVLADPVRRYVSDALRTVELAVSGLQQRGADLRLLRTDFESAALPLEFFLRGLDSEPALQRSA